METVAHGGNETKDELGFSPRGRESNTIEIWEEIENFQKPIPATRSSFGVLAWTLPLFVHFYELDN